MNLLLKRVKYEADYTIGNLFVDGVFQCYTLEDERRTTKVAGETAIWEGTYPVLLTHSPRFKRVLPLLINVPQFDGVRIHPGNDDDDTDGCILVGNTWSGGNFIGESRVAFDALFEKLKATKERIQITIM